MHDSIVPHSLLLLALSQDEFDFVSKWVNDAFPLDLDDYSATSLCTRLISTISLSLVFLPYPNEDERPQGLESSHQYVIQSNAVLQTLASITQSSVLEIDETSSKTSQKARKYAQRTRQVNKSVDMAPFRALHLKFPILRDEAKGMASDILWKQKEILSVTMFAPLFQSPQLTSFVSNSGISTCSALNHSRARSREITSHLPS